MFRIRVTSVDKLLPKYLYYAIENLAQTHGQLSLDNLKNTKLKDEMSGDERLLNDYCESDEGQELIKEFNDKLERWKKNKKV